ncbi:site-specific integrase [Streptomyces sp. G2]|uniref:tyrosine-type recombinase/integrase n=1 Tax=Streptomyces sp. G2 TaxID=1684471 RepID=UPI002030B144|nr:tyrosine-type recombinase/integrase [Streptomyces sp. G2]MCM1947736.1 site-specific integrase [Streptomyces sp. G2]
MTAPQTLSLLVNQHVATRTAGDRLEILQALIAGPAFDPLFRGDVLRLPAEHPVYGWRCQVEDCERSKEGSWDLCHRHQIEWAALRDGGATFTSFMAAAEPFTARSWSDARPCRICPGLPAVGQWGLCVVHAKRWTNWERWTRKHGRTPLLEDWLPSQSPLPGMGKCQVLACSELADHLPLRMCSRHRTLYARQGRPGDPQIPDLRKWGLHAGQSGTAEITYGDKAAFRHWCRTAPAVFRMNGTLSLLGLRPLVKAEIQWTLFNHTQGPMEGARWQLRFVQHLAEHCRTRDATSLADLDLDQVPVNSRKIAATMLNQLRQVYFTREDTKQAGFIETAHYGVHFPYCGSRIDLVMISQTWLRDLVWDHFDTRLRNNPPRSSGMFKSIRRALAELSAYLEIQAPDGGHQPTLLTENHMIDFVADQRHRARFGLEPLGRHEGPTGKPGRKAKDGVTSSAVARILNGTRTVLRAGLDEGTTTALGLDRRFVLAVPPGGATRGKRGRPFSDDTARALANDVNLALLDERDVEDRGLQDIWEALVVTGRRCNEVIRLRLDCIGRHNNLPLLWHDQTKVGNLDEAIRIPERLVQRIEVRQAKTIDRFVQRNGRPPTPEERAALALFPRRSTNRNGHSSMSYGWFQTAFSAWVTSLELSGVPHQARHTLATKLLEAGANLTHIKRYLGQVSDAMAEHYTHIANTDPRLNDALNAVWVAGPGAAEPGLLLSSGESMTRQQAEALAIDLTRRSTPAEGGFCTFQPVVNGDACPFNMDCHNCDKFVLSGADLVYWHRKREQWRTLAERAPDPATADFLHDVFEPTARAIDGLEKALAAVDLLDEALALDLRRPQDYFGRIWNTAFRARDLHRHESEEEVA